MQSKGSLKMLVLVAMLSLSRVLGAATTEVAGLFWPYWRQPDEGQYQFGVHSYLRAVVGCFKGIGR